jgi:ribosomal protein L11 methyltransferase
MTWYKLLLLPSDPQIDSEGLDSICSELMEAGASGTTIDTPPEIACFVESSSAAEMQRLSLIAEQLGCRVLSHEEVLEENWTASCPELWQPVAAGTLQVVPVESPTDAREVPAGAIKIIPGLGFGTGHHPTTNMLLGELSQLQPSTPFAAVLDLGTGSGILGIAAAKLFGAPVTAIDIDPLAVANAADNVALNGVEGLVSVSTTPLSDIRGSFPLILANVYGEALVALSAEITRVASPGCIALLSGITDLVCEQVIEAFCTTLGWRLEREQSQGEWLSLVLSRS